MYIYVLKFIPVINVFTAYINNHQTLLLSAKSLNYFLLADTVVYIRLTNTLWFKAHPFTGDWLELRCTGRAWKSSSTFDWAISAPVTK